MPYASVSEVPAHVPAGKKKQWMEVWNSAHAAAKKKGASDEEAETTAFKEANGVVKKADGTEDVTFNDVGAEGAGTDSVEKTMPEIVENVDKGVLFSFEISKVDEEKREIEGQATAEVVDKQGELMTYEGSKAAFRKWVGNVREMHQPMAVGTGVKVTFNDENKTIVVRSRISKGAPNTWEKVLDKTLKCYSVTGEREVYTLVKKADLPAEMFVDGSSTLNGRSNLAKKADIVVKTEKWRMTDLSLVDSGANPGSTFDLVKEVNGVALQTEVLEGDVAAEAQKAVLTSKERKNMPKSSFGYVDAKGKGHYPVKDSSGKCDAIHTRNALSRAAAAMKRGGTSADIARKSMPKIRACAKKLKIGAFHEKADLFVAVHNISKIEFEGLEDRPGVNLQAKDGEFLAPDKVLEVAKYYSGEYATSFAYTPVDFETAYERYSQSADLQRQYDMTELLQQVIIATMSDPDLDLDGKHTMVAQSTDQFVSIFFEEAAEAADDDEETEKVDKGDKTVADEKKVEAVVAAPAAPSAIEAQMAKFMESFTPDSIKKVVDSAVAPISTQLTDINKRLEIVEKAPAAKKDGTPVYRMIEKDGSMTDVSRGNGGGMVAVVPGTNEEYDIAKCDAELADIQKGINALPLGDSARQPLEIKFMKINRIKKSLSGQGVWSPARS